MLNIDLSKSMSGKRLLSMFLVILSCSVLALFLTDDMNVVSDVVTGTVIVVSLFGFIWMLFELKQEQLNQETKKEINVLAEDFFEIEYPGGKEVWLSKELSKTFPVTAKLEATVSRTPFLKVNNVTKSFEKKVGKVLRENAKAFSDTRIAVLLSNRKIGFSIEFKNNPDKNKITEIIIASKNIFETINS